MELNILLKLGTRTAENLPGAHKRMQTKTDVSTCSNQNMNVISLHPTCEKGKT